MPSGPDEQTSLAATLSGNQTSGDKRPSLLRALRLWWRETSQREGQVASLGRLLRLLREFLRDGTPERRRQRYGDVDYDWDYRVDTTSATVSWRARLIGLLHSPYQPTDPALFREMLTSLLQAAPEIDLREFTFIDVGSGKGRALLMASDYPFRRILGIELLPELHRVAQENIARYKSDSQQCFAAESICGDARNLVFPPEPMVLYLFKPLPEAGLVELLKTLEDSLREHPRAVYVVYHNPLLADAMVARSGFRKLMSTHQYVLYRQDPGAGPV